MSILNGEWCGFCAAIVSKPHNCPRLTAAAIVRASEREQMSSSIVVTQSEEASARIATLERELAEAQAQLAERTREREADLRGYIANMEAEHARAQAATDRAESAERQVEKMREALLAIRDSTYRNAVTLRGMADAALAQQEGGEPKA